MDKLWIYTNYDCNLRCSYCVARSSPEAPRRAICLEFVKDVVEEARMLGFNEIFFTGGEPFILADIYPMLEYASQRMRTSVLTNGMLFSGKRLEKLSELANENLTVQISLDGGRAEHHDAYRGEGTWQKTVAGIRRVQQAGLRVRLSTTETPANTGFIEEICALHQSLGIGEEEHFIRPLAKRGFSNEGMEVSTCSLEPELTINADGVFWHPLSTDADMQVSDKIFPLADAVTAVRDQVAALAEGKTSLKTYT